MRTEIGPHIIFKVTDGDMQANLPVELMNGVFLDAKLARAFGEQLAGEYCFADPYPHIVLDNFLPEAMAEGILANFPLEKKDGEVNFVGGYFEHNKRQILPYACNQVALNYFLFFNSAPFLQFLEGLTTIDGLIPDPYFSGGGFHEIAKGGKLGIHADFRIQNQLHLNRRLNVLIYLNKDWDQAYGGELEIWDRGMTAKIKGIQPVFNRCVIFNTDADSYHGHPDPLNTPDAITRKSLALYYYTASKAIYDEVPNLTTQFRARSENEAKQIQLNSVPPPQSNNVIPPLRDLLPPILYRNLRNVKRKYFNK